MLHHVSPCRPGRHCALPIFHHSLEWKKNRPQNEGPTLRRTLLLYILSLVKERPQKIQLCKTGDQLLAECEVQASSGRQELASASMVPSDQGVGDQWQATINTHGRHDAETGRSDSAMPEGEPGAAISLSEITGDSRCSHTLEVGPRCQGADGAPCLSEHGSSSVWQLVSFRMKIHSLSQSKLADQIQQILYPKSKK